uniref:Uncharacterized protein n=1 Tax=Lotus japonicus TaxID=34305 RepID=I3S9Q5_LOTJA|nr:unknown [Lotus japonicus]
MAFTVHISFPSSTLCFSFSINKSLVYSYFFFFLCLFLSLLFNPISQVHTNSNSSKFLLWR